ncbi:MAG: hypothetical protein K2Q22_17625, partial [Cytophagales bacterium]|nr:hypothetical protein [Cytophagales bacterium]
MKSVYSYSAIACLGLLIIIQSCIPKKDIKPRVGTYYFYPDGTSIGDITVTINGLAINYPSYTSSYSCSSSSITKFSLAPGTYTYSASNSLGTYSWSGSIYV